MPLSDRNSAEAVLRFAARKRIRVKLRVGTYSEDREARRLGSKVLTGDVRILNPGLLTRLRDAEQWVFCAGDGSEMPFYVSLVEQAALEVWAWRDPESKFVDWDAPAVQEST